MPRRSSQPDPASPEAPMASKRRASARLSAAEPGVKRVKSNADLSLRQAKSTTSKSKYFEPKDSDEPDSESDASARGSSGSLYEAEESPAEDAEPEELSDPDEDARKNPSARGKQRHSTGSGSDLIKGQELWREGVRAGLEPGQEVIIAKPKAREAGKIPYQDETLHPNTRLFLIDLATNNDRQWLKAHDPDYRAAKKDFETFVDSLTPKIAEVDATVPELPVKDLVGLRILLSFVTGAHNHCPRYSASIGMSASARIHFHTRSRTGKKGPYAAYYVHFQPGSCFVGCGLWNPESEPLALLREDIDENSAGLKEVLRAPEMRREFLKGVSDDDDAVVDAFTHHNKESALKTKPKV
ncbi:unnamed protein product [Penicillium nalgiovense]|uniref:Uncharacterized protein n=1 Tax=Penicillium nalgiovense TaxID=60175 RepID=A0A9W4IKL0_PENNA|nr:unnamed protein product [Penicillium nalgiovense]CAG7972577.1 unnamed protein product [Penicillium nalgiovense]CAG8023324.1 unnamed protein product [Penicillium nalgiovense]CAG8050928.1 unnamed protein product [Penicillium nalgiovense]CAG8084197.1 unnamed protein product [Penicillium nalgiovense]